MSNPDADASRLAAESINKRDPTGWFEQLYTEAAEGRAIVPWDRTAPNALIGSWIRDRAPHRGRALVVGCGYGTDSEFIASLGYDTTAFDISQTAIDTAHARFPESVVQYEVADVLDLPQRWLRAFDVVIESITVQSMPVWVRQNAVAAIASTVAPGGSLLVVSGIREDGVEVEGPPWPLTREEIESFASTALTATRIERVTSENRWRATFMNELGSEMAGD
ncbi:methyltransferase type 12 [Rhodococcoides trifolii]|uniref:Methyltransferase type 12 n=1 Tax=Rhodococcoides trifolii TaxID=908250 RepID=A0A917G7U1_9NOCA|nr:class I SAM-dependent methyltransferase [Rhodococcus trifolii]GGG27382.1 methyltransferase type 12 [Rhodococcus trifolii]